ncbi:hypothetical protein S40293_01832 [Stachybotrys chartarum IBT 40293]|nr:hypothetical protein S40293_01832 [Stachybotrys chartarum IBT 40293]
MTADDGPPLSLRPFPVANQKPKTLAEFIARVNAQPGGFRATTKEKLEEEIRASESKDGAADGEDVQMSDGEGDDSASNEGEPESSIKDPNQARMEVLRDMDIMGNTAMLTLDFLSLLLSKYNPTHASQTLSQQLRDMVGIGTLGADKLYESSMTEEKAKNQAQVAAGWTLMETNKTRDAAEEATAFLEKEMEAEGKYWDDVVSVQKAGWSVCRMPNERHTLGVRFGFSEAAPEFRANSLAPLRRADDGSVQLDSGRLGGVSERLLVTYEKDGQVVSRSSLPPPISDDAPLEARVLEARNTIYSQELWHELTRESRTLVAYDVRLEGSRLTCEVDSSTRIIVELVPLETLRAADEQPQDGLVAEAISLALHILLGHAHRTNELVRTRPIPPYVSRPKGQQIHALLRPIIARTMHDRDIREATKYVGSLVQALQKAGLPASLVLSTPQVAIGDGSNRGPNQTSSAQTLVRTMLQPLDFTLAVTILPTVSFTVQGRTHLSPVTATYYHVTLPPESPLEQICKPYHDVYPDLQALADYLNTATARVLSEHILSKLMAAASTADWIQDVRGTSIRNLDRQDFDLGFAIDKQDDKPALVVRHNSEEGQKRSVKKWTWAAAGDSEGSSLHHIVGQIVGQDLPDGAM